MVGGRVEPALPLDAVVEAMYGNGTLRSVERLDECHRPLGHVRADVAAGVHGPSSRNRNSVSGSVPSQVDVNCDRAPNLRVRATS